MNACICSAFALIFSRYSGIKEKKSKGSAEFRGRNLSYKLVKVPLLHFRNFGGISIFKLDIMKSLGLYWLFGANSYCLLVHRNAFMKMRRKRMHMFLRQKESTILFRCQVMEIEAILPFIKYGNKWNQKSHLKEKNFRTLSRILVRSMLKVGQRLCRHLSMTKMI